MLAYLPAVLVETIRSFMVCVRALSYQVPLALLLLLYASITFATNKLPVPRFVTIKFDEVNVRTGPDKDCPIEWVFIKKGEPVEIVAEYDQWRKIRDINGDGGWVHSSLLSRDRSVVIVSSNIVPLFSSPQSLNNNDNQGIFDVVGQSEQYHIVAKLSPKLRCAFRKCQGDWCYVTCKSYKGWVLRKLLWGVYPEE